MVVKPMAEFGYLKGPCFCIDPRGCWHGCCRVRRQLRSGLVLLENGAGFVRLARPGEVVVKRPATAIPKGGDQGSCQKRG